MPLDPAKLDALIRARSWSNSHAARVIGIPRPRLVELLRGGRSDGITLATVERLAAALGVTVADLITRPRRRPTARRRS